jgi:hypothetical protein
MYRITEIIEVFACVASAIQTILNTPTLLEGSASASSMAAEKGQAWA